MTWSEGLTGVSAPAWLSPPRTADEQLLWQGRASRAPLAVRMTDALHTVTGAILVFVGLSLIRNGGLAGFNLGSDNGMFRLVGWFLLSYGVFEVFGRHAINFLRRRSTSYALTNYRAFIQSGVFRPTVRERTLAEGPEISVRRQSNDRGTIVFSRPETDRVTFGPYRRTPRRDLNTATATGVDGFQFYGIPEVEQVKGLIDQALIDDCR